MPSLELNFLLKNLEDKMKKDDTLADRLSRLKQSIEDGVCNLCGEQVLSFEDPFSEREYNISGQCQHCQDKIFESNQFLEEQDEV